MGKKSKPNHVSKPSSSHSIVNIYKNRKKRRNKKSKTKENIEKLFNTLRNKSDLSNSSNSLNNTIIEVDKTIKNTDTNAINVNNKPSNSNSIVIEDEDLITNNEPCPVHCSTPINKQIFNKRITSQSNVNNMSTPLNFSEDVQVLTNEINRDSHFENLLNTPCNVSDLSNSFNSLNNTIMEVGNTKPKTDTCAKNLNDKPSIRSLIVIEDEDLITNNEPCPVQTSTPINSQANLNETISSPSKVNNNNSRPSFYEKEQNILSKTKEINRDSYLTIDLTTDSGLNATKQSSFNTVIDLVNSSEMQDCTVSDDSLSMSGDSDVTVINTKRKNTLSNNQMKKFANGIAKLDSSERGKLLEYITNKIFSGCNGPNSSSNSLHNLKTGINRPTETAEDTYIKEVILGCPSRNSIGSNIYNPERDKKNRTGLRMIVIDGSNVAMQHTKGRIFSVKGLKICIDYFVQRGHVVKAFVPQFRCKNGKSTDGRLLDQLERQGLVVYTPSREVQGKMIMSYDDRYIVQCAAEFDGVIVSGDNYRDLLVENPRWRHVIENRLLQFTWVGDMIMFPRDPLGRHGPTLEQFLKHPS